MKQCGILEWKCIWNMTGSISAVDSSRLVHFRKPGKWSTVLNSDYIRYFKAITELKLETNILNTVQDWINILPKDIQKTVYRNMNVPSYRLLMPARNMEMAINQLINVYYSTEGLSFWRNLFLSYSTEVIIVESDCNYIEDIKNLKR